MSEKIRGATDEEIDAYFAWRDEMRAKHRVMNLGEYQAWSNGGDAISSVVESNPFPGGLTITFDKPAIIGSFREDTHP